MKRKVEAINEGIEELIRQSPVVANGHAYYRNSQLFGKNAHGVFVDTGHYSLQAIVLTRDFILPNVEKNPNDWLFLVEGGIFPITPEGKYFRAIAGALRVPICDPIINPYSREMIEASGIS